MQNSKTISVFLENGHQKNIMNHSSGDNEGVGIVHEIISKK